MLKAQKSADALWSKAVKAKAGYRCEMCFRQKQLNSHHVFSRRYLGLRYDINNGVALCPDCHINRAHQQPTTFSLWILKKRGEDWHNQLLLKTQTICKNPDYSLIEIELKKIIENNPAT